MDGHMRQYFTACLLVAGVHFAASAVAQRAPDQVTVPLIVEANRPYIALSFHRPDGTTRTARFLLDTGGGGFLLTEGLAKDLGLTWGAKSSEDGSELARVTNPPSAWVGDFPLTLNPDRVIVKFGSDSILPTASGAHADGLMPGHVLSQYHVVFDYPGAKFTLAKPGVLTPRGQAIPMPVGRPQGYPRTEIEVDGQVYGMLLDTGASFTMVSENVLKSWGSSHPDWPRHPGAYGEAKTLGGVTLETMFLPKVAWAQQALADVGVTSQGSGTFETYMSRMMAKPIVGSLAGNVLKAFRVDLDYGNQTLYVSR
jgi:predicted aspartyl protease